MDKLGELVVYEDLSDGMRLVSEKSGMDFTKTLMLNHPGEKIYVPHLKYIRPLVKRFLKERIKTCTYREILGISKELNVSIEFLYILIREMYKKRGRSYVIDFKKKDIPDQTDLYK